MHLILQQVLGVIENSKLKNISLIYSVSFFGDSIQADILRGAILLWVYILLKLMEYRIKLIFPRV